MSKPVYRPYYGGKDAQINLTKVGGEIVLRGNQPQFKFPNKEAFDEFLRLNRERWEQKHGTTNAQ